MIIEAKAANTKEFGVYKANGAIVLGALFDLGETIYNIIVQIDEPLSDQRKDFLGMYVEIDGVGFYGGVKSFNYIECADQVELTLNPQKSGGISSIRLEIPRFATDADRENLRAMVHVYRGYCQTKPT